jgi:Golgi apyrase
MHSGLVRKETIAGNDIELKGGSDFESCLAQTRPLLNESVSCPEHPCLFNGVHAPKIDFERQRFVGVSEYWYEQSYSSLDVTICYGPLFIYHILPRTLL